MMYLSKKLLSSLLALTFFAGLASGCSTRVGNPKDDDEDDSVAENKEKLDIPRINFVTPGSVTTPFDHDKSDPVKALMSRQIETARDLSLIINYTNDVIDQLNGKVPDANDSVLIEVKGAPLKGFVDRISHDGIDFNRAFMCHAGMPYLLIEWRRDQPFIRILRDHAVDVNVSISESVDKLEGKGTLEYEPNTGLLGVHYEGTDLNIDGDTPEGPYQMTSAYARVSPSGDYQYRTVIGQPPEPGSVPKSTLFRSLGTQFSDGRGQHLIHIGLEGICADFGEDQPKPAWCYAVTYGSGYKDLKTSQGAAVTPLADKLQGETLPRLSDFRATVLPEIPKCNQ